MLRPERQGREDSRPRDDVHPLRDYVLYELRREVKLLRDRVDGKGFTPRSEKRRDGGTARGSAGVRFAAFKDLPAGGKWSQNQYNNEEGGLPQHSITIL
ncbi:hypothetical protein CYMTET_11455 [Cymbomonas tetramitiformis]|uniref:Uncharacterized protein n=1 Tax=Cymbomonas tetramitiformis TaxID=36881 RepID=A0AAE0GMA6_9CHLO|nr:hypothetical protein CYMTET_11455 [Cymbomonas tetramitiformis]